MKIYRREAFLKLPPGTIYAKGKRWYFGQISVKGDTRKSNDFDVLSPMGVDADNDGELFDRMEQMLQHGASYPMEESYGRDGGFNDNDLFLVPERADLEKLHAIINDALKVAP